MEVENSYNIHEGIEVIDIVNVYYVLVIVILCLQVQVMDLLDQGDYISHG